MSQVCLENDCQRLIFDSFLGGRAVSWLVDGQEVLARHADHPVQFGMYPMAPWAGRILGNEIAGHPCDVNFEGWAIHGTCFDAPVDDVDKSESSVVFRQRIPKWPFGATLTTEWRLEESTLVTVMTMTSEEPSPCIIGWHPWFRRVIGDQAAQWRCNDPLLAVRDGVFPSGELQKDPVGPFDDVFSIADAQVEVQWGPGRRLCVESSHPWFVVFDQLPDALCIEPQTAPPNAFTTPWAGTVVTASPEAPVRLANSWTWEFPTTK